MSGLFKCNALHWRVSERCVGWRLGCKITLKGPPFVFIFFTSHSSSVIFFSSSVSAVLNTYITVLFVYDRRKTVKQFRNNVSPTWFGSTASSYFLFISTKSGLRLLCVGVIHDTIVVKNSDWYVICLLTKTGTFNNVLLWHVTCE